MPQESEMPRSDTTPQKFAHGCCPTCGTPRSIVNPKWLRAAREQQARTALEEAQRVGFTTGWTWGEASVNRYGETDGTAEEDYAMWWRARTGAPKDQQPPRSDAADAQEPPV